MSTTRLSGNVTAADPVLRRARLRTYALFMYFGAVLALWATHIPVVTDRAGVSNTLFGMLLVLSGLGAIGATQLAGWLNSRYGGRITAAVAGLALALALLLPGLVAGPASLAAAMAIFGMGSGLQDVAMNQQATLVERACGRPVLSSYHACCSASVLGGSMVCSGTLALGWNTWVTFTLAAAAGVAATAWGVTEIPAATTSVEQQDGAGRTQWRPVAALGALAFVLFMCEGAAGNWSALHLIQHLDVSKAVAALSVTAVAVAMTVGRLAGDRVTMAIGPVAVLRYGSAIAMLGIGTVVVSPWPALTLAAWTLFGLGVSCGIPQAFSAAGRLSPSALSRVFGIGYTGLLAGPAVVGWLARVMPLNLALTAVFVAALIACIGAGAVRRP